MAVFLEGKPADGLRKCLAEDVSQIHVFHFAGNQRTSGGAISQRGWKILIVDSRAPIAYFNSSEKTLKC